VFDMAIDEYSIEADLLSEARTEVANADHKASVVLAALGIGFSAILGGVLASNWRPSDLSDNGQACWWFGTVCVSISMVCASLAVWPRTGEKSKIGPIYYWGQVAQTKCIEELIKRFETDPPDRANRTMHQLFHISHLVQRKYLWIRSAIGFGAAAALFFALSGLTEL
jgi:hypothetical protein